MERYVHKDTYVGTARLYKCMGGVHRLFTCIRCLRTSRSDLAFYGQH